MVNRHLPALLEVVLFVLLSSYLCRAWTIKNTLPTFWYQNELDCKPLEWSSDCENNVAECSNGLVCNYTCTKFKQSCFNNTAIYTCNGYDRQCFANNTCYENYGSCVVEVDLINSPEKAPEPFIPAKVYPYCVPGIVSLRDHCNATLVACKGVTFLDENTGRPFWCNITCEVHNSYCINYTRACTVEKLSCQDTELTKQCKVHKDFKCDFNVTTREEAYAIDLIGKYNKRDPLANLIEYKKIETAYYEETIEKCVEANEVPYNLQCNYMGAKVMGMLAPVIYEGRAYDAVDGVREFLSDWDVGYSMLCQEECWHHLIKLSRACWKLLPLQYFLPGSDYRTFELFIRNTTDVMCFRTPPPTKKHKGDMEYLNRGNSCITFFDPTHSITANHTIAITKACSGVQEEARCTDECNSALSDLKEAFGCCIGLIIRQFNFAKGWLALVNFDNNFMLHMLNRCTSVEETRNLTDVFACDRIVKFSLAVEIVKYMMYVFGTVLGVGIIAMTVSFYWQLEHEPLKKEFYHF